MEDFNALAMSLALGIADVRGCLVLSRDGLVLGAHPAEAEGSTTRAWIRFATIGDPERGFVQFGTETWCYVRRTPYAGFAVAGPGPRPGLVIDHMEQVLLAAEESRSRHEGLRGTEAATAATRSEPRSHLDPEHPAPDPLVIDVPAPVVARSSSGDSPDPAPPLPSPEPETSDEPVGEDAETPERPADPFAELVGARTSRPPPAVGADPPVQLRTRCAGPTANRGPTPNRGSSPSTRRTRGRERARRRAPEPISSPRTRAKRRTTTSTDSRSRGSSAELLQRGEDPADG